MLDLAVLNSFLTNHSLNHNMKGTSTMDLKVKVNLTYKEANWLLRAMLVNRMYHSIYTQGERWDNYISKIESLIEEFHKGTETIVFELNSDDCSAMDALITRYMYAISFSTPSEMYREQSKCSDSIHTKLFEGIQDWGEAIINSLP